MEVVYSTIKVVNRLHVLKEVFRSDDGRQYPNPNYLKTGKALCGILEKNQTLEEWCEKYKKLGS